ncbi:MAG TPA: LuxR C-terminal-related transcriptional regulator [Parafilimonas sp.]|nr:LuxR C-terminal-related transcriptional regulator [Parafilimonas sp.]
MEFRKEELVEREIEIANYLALDFSLKQICDKTGLQKKIVTAHIRNMMEKLGAKDRNILIQLLKDADISK